MAEQGKGDLDEIVTGAGLFENLAEQHEQKNQRGRSTEGDAEYALDLVKQWADTPEKQQAAIDALVTKCDILWAQLDALYHAYVEPRHVPPGAFVPEEA